MPRTPAAHDAVTDPEQTASRTEQLQAELPPALPAGQRDAASGRRELLALGVGCGAAVCAGWPLVAAVLSTDSEPTEHAFTDVAAEADVRAGMPLKVALRGTVRDGWARVEREVGTAFLVRAAGSVVALSASCPHLGCAVEATMGGFSCPCHESFFDAHGERLSGPAPHGLRKLDVQVAEGRVRVKPA